jgi:histidinol-phosphate aminotransferase
VDEAYIAFADEPGVESAASLIEEWPNLLTVHTLSKAASLAGLRVGFAIAGEELIEGLCRVRDSFNSYTLDRLALAAAAAAVRDPAYYDQVNRKVIATRRRVSAGLAEIGCAALPAQAHFMFVRPPEGIKAAPVCAALRDKCILTRHFHKPRIDNFLRISMGTDEEMDVFLERCRDILEAK